MFQPMELIQAYERLDEGEAKLSGIQYAIQQADIAKDYSYMLFFRYEYAEYSMDSDGLMLHMYIVFPEMLKIFEEHPDVKLPDNCCISAVSAIKYIFGNILTCSDYFYQIPIRDMEQYFEKYKSFCKEYGFDLYDYYQAAARFYRSFDKEKALENFEECKKLARERHMHSIHTIDFEAEMEFYYGNIKKALHLAKPFLDGKYSNTSTAIYEYGRFLAHYLSRDFNLEKAGYYYEKLVNLSKRLRKRPLFFLDELVYLILTDLDAAWNFYKKEARHQTESTIPIFIKEFSMGSSILMRYLSNNKRSQVHIRYSHKLPCYREDGCYQTKELAVYFDKTARELIDKFDNRGGSQYYLIEYKQYLSAAKLLDSEN